MTETFENILSGIRQWVNDKIEKLSFVLSVHINNLYDNKQNKLTAGENISIDSSNTISAVDTTYNAGSGISIDSGNTISVVDMMPIGSIIMWATNTAPSGWLICSGQSISGDEYTELRNVLGTNVVPDMSPYSSLNFIIKYTTATTNN